MSRVLITAAHTVTALKLSKAFTNDELILADYGLATELKIANYKLVSLDKYRRNALAHNLLAKCLDWGIEVLVPVYFEEMEALSTATMLFDEYGIKVIAPNASQYANFARTNRTKDWLIAANGTLLFSSDATNHSLEDDKLTGVYSINTETNTLAIYGLAYYEK